MGFTLIRGRPAGGNDERHPRRAVEEPNREGMMLLSWCQVPVIQVKDNADSRSEGETLSDRVQKRELNGAIAHKATICIDQSYCLNSISNARPTQCARGNVT